MIFHDEEISYGLAIIRVPPLRMADCLQQVQLNFLPDRILIETNEFNQFLPYLASKLPKNLMLLHGAVVYLKFFAIKTPMEWLD